MHAGGAALADLLLLGLLLVDTLVHELSVLVLRNVSDCSTFQVDIPSTYGSVLGGLGLAALECDPVALVLETLGSDETLDARSLGVGLGTLSLGLDLTANDELADLDHNYGQY